MTTSSTSSNSMLTSVLSGLTNSSTSSNSNSGSGTSSTIGGLITAGQIDVSVLVSELMTIQDMPLTQIQNQESGINSKISAYGQLQSALGSVQSAAQTLSLATTFDAMTATATGTAATATVTGAPAPGNYNVSVSSLATSESLASAPTSTPNAAQGTGTLTIQLGTYNASGNSFSATSGSSPITVNITSANNSLSGIASAINNAANGAVTASVVSDSSGNSRLVISSATTGAANGFNVSASGSLTQFAYDPTSTSTQPMTQTQPPKDAVFSVNGLSLTSSSNSVSTAINGLTLNLAQAPASGATALQSQISVSTDTNSINTSINALVTAYNSYVNLSSSLTSYNATSKSGSALTGDPSAGTALRTLQSILGGSTSASGTTPSTRFLAQIGITTSTNGTLSINTTKLDSALQANPGAVAAMFTGVSSSQGGQGFAVQINNAVTGLLSNGGAIGATEHGLNTQLTYLQNKASMLQQTLTQEQNNMLQEYATLNANVTAAQAEQTQIANEMATLPG